MVHAKQISAVAKIQTVRCLGDHITRFDFMAYSDFSAFLVKNTRRGG
jgi:predicted phosphodiesterase